jgi:hypothetical protein
VLNFGAMPTHLIAGDNVSVNRNRARISGSSPVTSFIRDFPHPEGPTTAANSPSLTSMLTPIQQAILGPPKDKLTLFNWTNGRERNGGSARACNGDNRAFMPSILRSRSGALRVGSV